VPALRGGSSEEDNTVATTDATSAPATNGKSRNVAGQLAGIHEQIKQLDEMSEDFLEDHQKMASILSRVDDQTQTASVGADEDEDTEKAD
jgi:C4-type Zn-finger protein